MWGGAQAAGAATRGTLITEPAAKAAGCDWPITKHVFDHLRVRICKWFTIDQYKNRKGLFGGGGARMALTWWELAGGLEQWRQMKCGLLGKGHSKPWAKMFTLNQNIHQPKSLNALRAQSFYNASWPLKIHIKHIFKLTLNWISDGHKFVFA